MDEGENVDQTVIEPQGGGLFMVRVRRYEHLGLDAAESVSIEFERLDIPDHATALRSAEALWVLAGLELARIGQRLEGKDT
jgi:hypothetical protein